MEKTVLLNAEVADQIAATIALHTRGDTRTVFFDGEGGPCHLGARVRDMGLFRSGEAAVHRRSSLGSSILPSLLHR